MVGPQAWAHLTGNPEPLIPQWEVHPHCPNFWVPTLPRVPGVVVAPRPVEQQGCPARGVPHVAQSRAPVAKSRPLAAKSSGAVPALPQRRARIMDTLLSGAKKRKTTVDIKDEPADVVHGSESDSIKDEDLAELKAEIYDDDLDDLGEVKAEAVEPPDATAVDAAEDYGEDGTGYEDGYGYEDGNGYEDSYAYLDGFGEDDHDSDYDGHGKDGYGYDDGPSEDGSADAIPPWKKQRTSLGGARGCAGSQSRCPDEEDNEAQAGLGRWGGRGMRKAEARPQGRAPPPSLPPVLRYPAAAIGARPAWAGGAPIGAAPKPIPVRREPPQHPFPPQQPRVPPPGATMAAGILCTRLLSEAEDPEVLLIKRFRQICWEFPKGRRQHPEAIRATAVREFEEETGADLSEFGPWGARRA